MRTLPATLEAALTTSPRAAAECVVLQASDGTVEGFTTWSRELVLDLSARGGPGPIACKPRATLSSLTLAAGFDASSFELSGAIGGEFTRAKVLGGKWNWAKAWHVRVSPGVPGYAPMMRGRVAEPRVEGRSWTVEVRSAAAAFSTSQGNVLQPWCRADFGDQSTGCPVVREPVPCTVTAVESAFVFAVDQPGVFADNHFFLGTVGFLTGALAGTNEMTIFAYDGTSAGMELFEPLIAAPQVGDTLNLYRGCSRLLKSDNPLVPTCLSYGAVDDFRAEPEVPGNRMFQRVTPQGSTYD